MKINRKYKLSIFIVFAVSLFFYACSSDNNEELALANAKKNELIVLFDGSLSKPVREVINLFEKVYPDKKIRIEYSGTCDLARKIADFGRPCDVFISADPFMTHQLLFNQFVEWQIPFAKDALVIAFSTNSNFSKEINAENWTKIVLQQNVRFGRTNPDSDPCGYRTILMFKLAQTYYSLSPEYYDAFMFKDLEFLQAQSTDLVSLLKENKIDYIFTYKSVAQQQNLKYVDLPVQINLSDKALDSTYYQAQIKIGGKNPGEFISLNGSSVSYSISVLKSSTNQALAKLFVQFLLNKDQGLKVLKKNYLTPDFSITATDSERIPNEILKDIH